MKYPMYSYKDKKVGFMPPVCDQSDQTAVRRFTYDVNEGSPYMKQFPDDYELYKIGVFDTDNGKISVQTPEFVIDGNNVYGVNS